MHFQSYRNLLHVLVKQPSYGYELAQTLGYKHASTVYARLQQLERQGLVVATRVAVPNAPDRTFYSVTGKGKTLLWYLQRVAPAYSLHKYTQLLLAKI